MACDLFLEFINMLNFNTVKIFVYLSAEISQSDRMRRNSNYDKKMDILH